MKKTTDLVIIGGGIIGCSVAYYATRAGLKTIVVEKRDCLTQEASWAAAGILAVHASTDQPYAKLCRLSLAMFPKLASELKDLTGIDIEFSPCGSLYLCFDEDEYQNWTQLARRRQIRGFSAQVLTPDEVTKLEPQTNPNILGGVLFPEDSQVRPPRLNAAIVSAAEKQGAQFLCGSPVDEFVLQNGKVVSVKVNGNNISADKFVITTGCWTEELTTNLDYPVSVPPIPGQMILTETIPKMIGQIVEGAGVYLVPRTDGKILIGATVESSSYDKRASLCNTMELIQAGIRNVPNLATAPLLQTWVGLRPYAKRKPYLGPLPGYDNIVVATGHYKNGILLAPITGRLVSQLITDQSLDLDIHPFRINR